MKIDGRAAKILKKVYTEAELEKLGLKEQVEKAITIDEAEFEYYSYDKMAEQIVEYSPMPENIIHAGWEYPVETVEKLLDRPWKDKYSAICTILDLCTDIGLIIPKEIIDRQLKELSDEEQKEIKPLVDKNQDVQGYIRRAEASLSHESPSPLFAYYYVKDLPAFEKFKERILDACRNNIKNFENDNTTRAVSARRTIIIICEQKGIVVDELEEIGDNLLDSYPSWAMTAYYLAGKIDKIKEMVEK